MDIKQPLYMQEHKHKLLRPEILQYTVKLMIYQFFLFEGKLELLLHTHAVGQAWVLASAVF